MARAARAESSFGSLPKTVINDPDAVADRDRVIHHGHSAKRRYSSKVIADGSGEILPCKMISSQEKPPAVQVTVLYFAAASTAAQRTSEKIALPMSPFPLRDLAALLSERHPKTGLESVLERSQWSVGAEMVPEEDVKDRLLQGGEEIGVICPVSGG